MQPHKADKNHSYFTGVEQGSTADALLCLGARSNLPSGYIESTVCARSRRTCLQGICHLRAVFGAGGVFGESVFARHLRAGIRLRSWGRLRGIRLRYASSGGNLSSELGASSGNPSSLGVFGGESVFGVGGVFGESVFARCLRGSSNIHSCGESVFVRRMRLRVKKCPRQGGCNVIIYIHQNRILRIPSVPLLPVPLLPSHSKCSTAR